MATPRKTPSVIVLTEDDLRTFMEAVQAGFADLNERLDALTKSVITTSKPGMETAKLRKEIAAAALKAASSRPSSTRQVPRRTP